MEHEWAFAGNTFASSWYLCEKCGMFVSSGEFITGAKESECCGVLPEDGGFRSYKK